MKKADKVARWREIRASNTGPPVLVGWSTEDEEELMRLKNREIDMSETYLGRYAALQKRNTVAAVLDFSEDEWQSLKGLREANAAELKNAAVTVNNDNIAGAFEVENTTNGGDYNKEAV